MRPVLAFLLAVPLFAQKQPFDADTMLRIARISQPELSPSGRQVAFTVQTIDVQKNTKPEQIYVVSVDGGVPRQITQDGTLNERPRWSPDSRQIYYVSNRGGTNQIWVMDADGGHAKQITRLSTEASDPRLTPDGKKLIFLSSVFPECAADDACNKKNLDDETQSKVKARVYTALLYRHWNEWQTKRRQHVMVTDAEGFGLKDLTPGPREIADDFTVSPDSLELAFTTNADPEPATSTNFDIYTVPLEGGDARKITSSPGADGSPLYSPDGKYLAFRSQQRAGYESDRWRLMVLERSTGRTSNLTEGLDRWVGSLTWSPDSTRIFLHGGGSRPHRIADGVGDGRGIEKHHHGCVQPGRACSSPPTAAP